MKTVLMLGRAGDLINLSPVLVHFARNGGARLVVSGEFAAVAVDIPGVVPVFAPVHYSRVDLALPYARALDPNVIVAQAYGRFCPPEYKIETVPFNLAAWLACGMTVEDFDDRARFPVSITRDPQRESALLRRLGLLDARGFVGVALTCGFTSPVPTGETLYGAVKRELEMHGIRVVNLCSIAAERIQDMTAILERARLLVLQDSAMLHLAAMTDVPVIAVQPDRPNSASRVRARLITSLRHSQLDTAVPLLDAIQMALGPAPDKFDARDGKTAALAPGA